MHGIPKWFEWLMEYGFTAMGLLAFIAVVWVCGAIFVMIKGWPLKFAVGWPVYLVMTPAQRLERVLAEAVGMDLSSWERYEFLPSIRQRATLTEKQEKVLAGIEARVFGDDDD